MATVQQLCANHEINIQMCPCTSESCPRRGVCCECISYHRNSLEWPESACMRGAKKRPEETLSLVGIADSCDMQVRNAQACSCSADSCERFGWCCECVRNHWALDGTGKVACVR